MLERWNLAIFQIQTFPQKQDRPHSYQDECEHGRAEQSRAEHKSNNSNIITTTSSSPLTLHCSRHSQLNLSRFPHLLLPTSWWPQSSDFAQRDSLTFQLMSSLQPKLHLQTVCSHRALITHLGFNIL